MNSKSTDQFPPQEPYLQENTYHTTSAVSTGGKPPRGFIRRRLVAVTTVISIVLLLIGGTILINARTEPPSAMIQVASQHVSFGATSRVCGTWNEIPGPTFSSTILEVGLYRAIVTSGTNIWVVGQTYESHLLRGGVWRPLIAHSDGNVWSQVPSPNLNLDDSGLYDIAAISANDIWAVGFSGKRGLIVHWDGTAWSIIGSPSNNQQSEVLHGVAALAHDNVWAVGTSGTFPSSTLIMHWDGRSWRIVTSPQVGPFENELTAISAVSPDDIWAVGSYSKLAGKQTLTIHWNGKTWRVIPSPNPERSSDPNTLNRLHSLVAWDPNNVWAVGSSDYFRRREPLAMYWNGIEWAIFPINGSSGSSRDATFFETMAISAHDVWAVGMTDVQFDDQQPLVQFWNGDEWSAIPTQQFTGNVNFNGILALSPNEILVIGHADKRAFMTLFSRGTCIKGK